MTQGLATRGRASTSPAVSMATAGVINTASSSLATAASVRGPSVRTTFLDPIPVLKRKP